ncbi:hypothetical protein B0A48_06854 [Cryoendolithus antarcticus]|uniref:Uncharacterized protein n=1 Tax=Cryoendolithus antarcticus TaxID=1507870 RepID=A0A1V8T9X3_9PEZI|nr:hypothetical protein B0A48_06854 [Cryoendolithus antarcticus]
MSASGSSERQPKRRRLDKTIVRLQDGTPDAQVSLDVDVLIIDYVTYQATIALLAEAKSTAGDSKGGISAAHNLEMTNAFLAIFKAKYADYQVDDELDFRILLLKFVTLYVRRSSCNASSPTPEALKALRVRNQQRAVHWIGNAERAPTHGRHVESFDQDLPLPLEDLERNRADVLSSLNAPAEDEAYEDAFYGTSSSLALLDLLPLFMEVSATRNGMSESTLTVQWMELAGSFILQACLEMYSVRGAAGSDAIDEAFAWGFESRETTTTGDDLPEVDAMFECEDEEGEVLGWAEIKQRYLDELIPRGGESQTPVAAHLESLAAAHSVAGLHRKLLHLLNALNASMSPPVLAQLENGSLEGFTLEQTAEFLEECGLPAGWPNVSM